MGLQSILETTQKAGGSSAHYMQALVQFGHAIILGILLMLLTMWVSRRAGKLQPRSGNRDDSSPAENLQGAINVLFFCFGMTGVMILVQDNIARAFAIGAAIALVRFRIQMGNLLSSAFLFSVVVGMACGTGNIQIAWIIAVLYSLVTILVSVGLAWGASSTPTRSPAADIAPGQLVRDAQGNWTCHFPRYAVTVDGITGHLISLIVKGDEVVRRTEPSSRAKDSRTFATSVAECDSVYARRCGLTVSHLDFNVWWHFLSDAIIIEYMAASESASGVAIHFTRNLSALSRPYPARPRHLQEAGQGGTEIRDTGMSAITRGGTPVVFYAPDMHVIWQEPGKQVHGIMLSGAVGIRHTVEIQIGPATSPVPVPSAP